MIAILLNSLVLFVLVAIVAGGLQTAGLIVQRLMHGEEVIPATPRQQVPWGLLDFCIAFLALAAGTVVLGVCLHLAFPSEFAAKRETPNEVGAEAATPPQSVILAMTVADSLLKIAVLLVLIPLISWRTGATGKDWGLDWSQLRQDIILGGRAFCVLIPIVMLIQATLVVVFQWPSKHPLIESLKESPSIALFAASFLAAVLVAPVAEEWSFRVLLQGWFEKVGSRQFNWEQLLVGGASLNEPAAESKAEPAENLARSAILLKDNPYFPPNDAVAEAKLAAVDASPQPWWPIIASAAIFALVHFSHGPDFVPLFILSLGLGYLYRQTHRITPSLVVHFGLNLMTMSAIGVDLVAGK